MELTSVFRRGKTGVNSFSVVLPVTAAPERAARSPFFVPQQLKHLGLISVGKELRTAGKKIHGRRYYQLSFQALRQTARSY